MTKNPTLPYLLGLLLMTAAMAFVIALFWPAFEQTPMAPNFTGLDLYEYIITFLIERPSSALFIFNTPDVTSEGLFNYWSQTLTETFLDSMIIIATFILFRRFLMFWNFDFMQVKYSTKGLIGATICFLAIFGVFYLTGRLSFMPGHGAISLMLCFFMTGIHCLLVRSKKELKALTKKQPITDDTILDT